MRRKVRDGKLLLICALGDLARYIVYLICSAGVKKFTTTFLPLSRFDFFGKGNPGDHLESCLNGTLG